MVRPALFGNLFGVLALFQSGRLVKVRALGVLGYVDWLGVVGGEWHALLTPSLPLGVPGLRGTDAVGEAAASPGPALQPLARAAPEGPGGHPLAGTGPGVTLPVVEEYGEGASLLMETQHCRAETCVALDIL